jgi:ABC-type multidrug transport system ATPase subunit
VSPWAVDERPNYRQSPHNLADHSADSQILVSHHVELLLPITDYIVRILDGRIDAQGTPADLKKSGALDGLIAIEGAEVAAEEPVTSSSSQNEEIEVVDAPEYGTVKKDKKKGPGKKLVQGRPRPSCATMMMLIDR